MRGRGPGVRHPKKTGDPAARLRRPSPGVLADVRGRDSPKGFGERDRKDTVRYLRHKTSVGFFRGMG
ncbi:hypothetical protein HMPREF1631_00150 [Arcanobacterium sp. S3PF19]|nr:hypothetical protein HMPREF1631_00150 [Arcanobacterium sp. S3PF19]